MREYTKEEQYILDRTMSTEFDEYRKNSLIVSHYKYGWPEDNYGRDCVPVSALENIKVRLAKYEETGNKDYLIDVANFAELEYQYPSHPKAHLNRNNEKEQPKLVGVSHNEIKNWDE
jgi:hypothetical protein